MNAIISTRGLVKRFGRTTALDGLDLEVGAGEVHGFVGPNGAGKSTTIRILLGLARATGGEATLFGRDPWTDAADLHRRVAYVPGTAFYFDGSGADHMRLSYCYPTPERIREGVRRLAGVVAGEKELVELFGTGAGGSSETVQSPGPDVA